MRPVLSSRSVSHFTKPDVPLAFRACRPAFSIRSTVTTEPLLPRLPPLPPKLAGAVPVPELADRAFQFGHGFVAQRPTQQRDGVAGLNCLGLLVIADRDDAEAVL